MKRQGVIEESQNLGFSCGNGEEKRWNSKVLRKLPEVNAVTVKDSYPIPRINDMLD